MARKSERLTGAAEERAEIRKFLRRQIKASNEYWATMAFRMTLDWILLRSKRYEKRPGGLGRKRATPET